MVDVLELIVVVEEQPEDDVVKGLDVVEVCVIREFEVQEQLEDRVYPGEFEQLLLGDALNPLNTPVVAFGDKVLPREFEETFEGLLV